MNKLNYEEISIIIEILGDRANMYQFLLSGVFKLENTSKIDKELELINSSIEKLTKEQEELLNEED